MVRVRIAPSPTGDPHVGTGYIALFNYAFAKQNGGSFVLRIEDTDQARSKPEWEEMLLSSLKWLGLPWDEGPDVGGDYGPYRQSERKAIYQEYIKKLIEAGHAYPCFCTAERLDALRKKQRENKEQPGYDGHCRDLDPKEALARMETEDYVIRLKVPEGEIAFEDHLRGEVKIHSRQIDDQVLIKTDGMPTYHFANVVDDHLMKITHVIRAEEWISSTPKHILLYRAFGWEPPVFVHMPLLRNPNKSKISKRKNPVSLNFYRDSGYYPEALRNYLGMMGWSMPDESEKFGLEDFVKNLDLKRVSLGGPVFDLQKLSWLNGLYLREKSVPDLVEDLSARILSSKKLVDTMTLLQERIERLDEFLEKGAFFFGGPLHYSEAATKLLVPKNVSPSDARKRLLAIAEKVDSVPTLDREGAEALLRAYCEEAGLKAKEVFMPVRVAVTGSKATPGLFESMEVLGKELVRQRLRGAAEHLKQG